MAGVGVAQVARGAVVDGDEESSEAVVAVFSNKMLVEAGDKLGGAHGFASGNKHLATQGRLQAGHQESGGNSFAGNIGDGDGQMSRAELDEIVVVTADRARGFADGFDFDAGDFWQISRK